MCQAPKISPNIHKSSCSRTAFPPQPNIAEIKKMFSTFQQLHNIAEIKNQIQFLVRIHEQELIAFTTTQYFFFNVKMSQVIYDICSVVISIHQLGLTSFSQHHTKQLSLMGEWGGGGSSDSYLIFVTGTTGGACGDFFVMWRNFFT